MIVPLIILAVGRIAGGLSELPGDKLGDFLGQSPSLVSTYEVARPPTVQLSNPSSYPNAAGGGCDQSSKSLRNMSGV